MVITTYISGAYGSLTGTINETVDALNSQKIPDHKIVSVLVSGTVVTTVFSIGIRSRGLT